MLTVRKSPVGAVWAKGPLGPVSAAERATNDEQIALVCYECENPVKFTREHQRILCGIPTTVREFFSHVRNSTCSGGGEGALHKASKDVRNVSYYDFCRVCAGKVYITIPGTRAEGGEQDLWLDGTKWRPDVSYFDAEGKVVGAVEIFSTHKISEQKAFAYTNAGIAWVEVDATAHLHAGVGTGPKELRVLRSAFEWVTDRVCESCIPGETENARVAEEARVRAAVEKQVALRADNESKARALARLKVVLPDEERALVEQFLAWRSVQGLPCTDQEYLPQKIDQPNLILKLPKHKGEHIDVVFEEDAGYVFWLVKSDADVHRELRARAKELTVGVCEVCFEGTGSKEAWKTMCSGCFRHSKKARGNLS